MAQTFHFVVARPSASTVWACGGVKESHARSCFLCCSRVSVKKTLTMSRTMLRTPTLQAILCTVTALSLPQIREREVFPSGFIWFPTGFIWFPSGLIWFSSGFIWFPNGFIWFSSGFICLHALSCMFDLPQCIAMYRCLHACMPACTMYRCLHALSCTACTMYRCLHTSTHGLSQCIAQAL